MVEEDDAVVDLEVGRDEPPHRLVAAEAVREHHRPPGGHAADGHAVPREDAAHAPTLVDADARRGRAVRSGGHVGARTARTPAPGARAAGNLCRAPPVPYPPASDAAVDRRDRGRPSAERGVHMTAAAVRPTSPIPVPALPAAGAPARPPVAPPTRRPPPAARSPTSGCCTSWSAASGGCSPSWPPGRRPARPERTADADPARRPDRPRPAAPPRRRARGRLAGAAPRRRPATRTAEVRRRARRLDRPLRPDRPHAARRLDRRPPVAGGRHRAARGTPSPWPASTSPTPSTPRPPRRRRVLLPAARRAPAAPGTGP